MLFFHWTRTTMLGAPKSEELTKLPMSCNPMTAPFRSRNWPAFADEICWICSYFVWNCSLRIRRVMNKNVLKSQNIGEGMISVHVGQNLCWKGCHWDFGWRAVSSFLRNTYNAGFSFFYCWVWYVTIAEYFLYWWKIVMQTLWHHTSRFYHDFTGRRNCGAWRNCGKRSTKAGHSMWTNTI